MNSLASDLRKQLERAVTAARDVAETAARAALEALAVQHHEPYPHMTPELRALRNQLRAHARQLGDQRDTGSGRQAIEHLVHECAYEHWHGMLFARFLAENHLLIESKMGIAISLDECEELAKEESADKWSLAARFAHGMLPQVFRPDQPVFQVQFAREHRLELESLLEGLPAGVFTASDSLGWVYQFWQSTRKSEVNRSEVKIGADELPAVTQLFTEPYMVQFLLQNSLGAWWVSRHPDKPCPVELTYLRKTETSTPSAGNFEGWPDDLHDFRLLDPCCGSGHFLVAAFLMLVPMHMALNGLGAAEAVDAVIRYNLHGLEIDQRCVAIAAFAIALEAWRYPDAGGFRVLAKLNLAWCGQPLADKRAQWMALAEGDYRLEAGLTVLFDTFRDAPILGSLIDPTRSAAGDLYKADFAEVRQLLEKALRDHAGDEELKESAIAALGLADAERLLCGQYHVVLTNVPYLGREKHTTTLRKFCDTYFPLAKHDLATVFLQRILRLCAPKGEVLLVLPQYWLFLARYKELRKFLLEKQTWHLLATLGPGAFETISGEVVNTCLVAMSPSPRKKSEDTFYWMDASKSQSCGNKGDLLSSVDSVPLNQIDQLENPDAVIGYVSNESHDLLENIAYCYQGLATSDNAQFIFNFWEIPCVDKAWELIQFAPESTSQISGCSHILLWEEGQGKYAKHAKALKDEGRLGGWKSGQGAWNKRGVAINRMGELPVSLYFGTKFDCNVAVLIPYDEKDLPAIWAYCSSQEYSANVRKLNAKLSVTNATLAKVPYDFSKWEKKIEGQSLDDLYRFNTLDPRQWSFHGHPRHSTSSLQVAVARMLGYRWPAENDPDLEISEEARTWVQKAKTLHSLEVDGGIVCISSVRGERPAYERLLRLLQVAWGSDWDDNILADLLADMSISNLDDWLRNDFFKEHCKLFQNRPFIWHIWDGRKQDGFHALVNYHKLAESNGGGRRLLETLTYSYLGDWIARQQAGVNRDESGAEDRLEAALELQKRLVAIIKGVPPFDLFVRWKPINAQPIGWEPDINDGIRLNIRPFMGEEVTNGKKGAGIFRSKPKIHWKKDRGRESVRNLTQFSWFWENGKFIGDRINDAHPKKQ